MYSTTKKQKRIPTLTAVSVLKSNHEKVEYSLYDYEQLFPELHHEIMCIDEVVCEYFAAEVVSNLRWDEEVALELTATA